MDKTENGRVSRRVGWVDDPEYSQFYNRTWKQKVQDLYFFEETASLSSSTQGTRIAVKTIGTLSMIALFIWQVLNGKDGFEPHFEFKPLTLV